MPEIKNTFLQGKMNKDLDERLIPNGQYREAMNVEVSTSEGASAGVVKNILGNKKVFGDFVSNEFECVGSIADEKTNKLYWFVSSYAKDAILEHDIVNDKVHYIFVDKNAANSKAVLKFSGNIITGINIINNLLFWTDNNSEPKKINIDECKKGTDQGGDKHTRLVFKNGSFDGITLKYVSTAAGFWLSSFSDQKKGAYFFFEQKHIEKLFLPFGPNTGQPFVYDASKYADFDAYMIRHYRNGKFLGLKRIKIFNNANGTHARIEYADGLAPVDDDWHVGDVIFGDDIRLDIEERHITVIKPKPLKAPTVKINHTQTLDSPSNIPNLFETTFPRFSYRYKYKDGEFSAFAPFTEPVFNPKYTKDINNTSDINVFYTKDNVYDAKDPHNKSMVNSIHSVELTDFITTKTPEDAIEIEILYKQENSSVIYSINTIKSTNPEWHDWSNHEGTNIGLGKSDNNNAFQAIGSYTKGKYIVTIENIYAALPANQLLRPWDNVPRKALGQEITGNRIVYGNYLQNYNLGNIKPEIKVNYSDRDNQLKTFENQGLPSIKSQRNYQLGIVYCDKYGRETPVFTSKEGAVNIPWASGQTQGLKNASRSLELNANVVNSFPEWVDSFKIFVKETSNPYYNLVMDQAWVAKSTYELDRGEHLWISFPSSDRNKISEEDYIILKKKIGTGEEQIAFENKFKVIDIANEAPDAIKYELVNYGSVSNTGGTALTSVIGDGFLDERIDNETDTIRISHGHWRSGTNVPLEDSTAGDEENISTKNLYLSWRRLDSSGIGVSSKKYKVTGGFKGAANYVLTLSTTISKIDADIAHHTGDSSATQGTNLHSDLVFQIEKRELKDSEDFSGKFFVKISKNQITDLIEEGSTTDTLDNYIVSAKTPTYYWQDDKNNGINYKGTSYGMRNWSGFDASPSGANSIHHPDNNNSVGNDNPITALSFNRRVSDDAAIWDGILLDHGNTFFVDAMYMTAAQSEASNYAKYCCVTWSGADGGGQLPNKEGSAWKYPPLKVWLTDWVESNNVIQNLDQEDEEAKFHDAIKSGLIDTSPLTSADNDFKLLDDDENGVKVTGWVGGSQVVNRRKAYTSLPDDPVKNHINALEGIVTTNSNHSTGPRRWFSGITGNPTDNGVGVDTKTYSDDNEIGRHFMHLSFFAPGKNLHNGDWGTSSFTMFGDNAPGNRLQGIWGGGHFNADSATGFIGNSEHRQVAMEGNNDTNDGNHWLPETPGPGVGFGYDLDYQELHERQWDPTFCDAGDPDNKIRDFIRNLHAGSQFKFSGDTSENVYTIKKVVVKKLYNHTSWRTPYNLFDGDLQSYHPNLTSVNSIHRSVEQTVLDWAQYMSSTGVGINNGSSDWDAASHAMDEKIVDFGKASNRRLCYIIELDKNPCDSNFNPLATNRMSADLSNEEFYNIEFLEKVQSTLLAGLNKFPAIWETDPKKQQVDLDIYYEASNNIPVKLNKDTNELLAPIGCKVEMIGGNYTETSTLLSWDGTTAILEPGLPVGNDTIEIEYSRIPFKFTKQDGSYVILTSDEQQLLGESTSSTEFKTSFVFKHDIGDEVGVGLSWYNCFSFGNGLESNRIRDDFNEMFITNGVKASTITQQTYEEEHRSHGLIYSGIYNSNSGVNNLNQFIMAEKITKDLNPTYGSIQKLFSRNSDLVTLCEDKVVKVLANKDALFNADGNTNLTATENVLGQSIPFVGEYGISTNPESFASESYRAYFTDKQRGAVLRLSKDGLTPISKAGMNDWFRDNLRNYSSLIGSYDSYKEDYNITLSHAYSENFIYNSYFDEGVELGTQEGSLYNYILNSGVGSGTDLVYARNEPTNRGVGDILTGEFEWGPPDTVFGSSVKVTNHAEIPAGSIQEFREWEDGFWTTIVTQEQVDPTYTTYEDQPQGAYPIDDPGETETYVAGSQTPNIFTTAVTTGTYTVNAAGQNVYTAGPTTTTTSATRTVDDSGPVIGDAYVPGFAGTPDDPDTQFEAATYSTNLPNTVGTSNWWYDPGVNGGGFPSVSADLFGGSATNLADAQVNSTIKRVINDVEIIEGNSVSGTPLSHPLQQDGYGTGSGSWNPYNSSLSYDPQVEKIIKYPASTGGTSTLNHVSRCISRTTDGAIVFDRPNPTNSYVEFLSIGSNNLPTGAGINQTYVGNSTAEQLAASSTGGLNTPQHDSFYNGDEIHIQFELTCYPTMISFATVQAQNSNTRGYNFIMPKIELYDGDNLLSHEKLGHSSNLGSGATQNFTTNSENYIYADIRSTPESVGFESTNIITAQDEYVTAAGDYKCIKSGMQYSPSVTFPSTSTIGPLQYYGGSPQNNDDPVTVVVGASFKFIDPDQQHQYGVKKSFVANIVEKKVVNDLRIRISNAEQAYPDGTDFTYPSSTPSTYKDDGSNFNLSYQNSNNPTTPTNVYPLRNQLWEVNKLFIKKGFGVTAPHTAFEEGDTYNDAYGPTPGTYTSTVVTQTQTATPALYDYYIMTDPGQDEETESFWTNSIPYLAKLPPTTIPAWVEIEHLGSTDGVAINPFSGANMFIEAQNANLDDDGNWDGTGYGPNFGQHPDGPATVPAGNTSQTSANPNNYEWIIPQNSSIPQSNPTYGFYPDGEQTIPENYLYVDGSTGTSGYNGSIQFDITDDPWVADSWYLVDLEYLDFGGLQPSMSTPSPYPGSAVGGGKVMVMYVVNDDVTAATFSNPEGVGSLVLHNNGHRSIQMQRVLRTEYGVQKPVLRALFKLGNNSLTSNSDVQSKKFRLQFYNFDTGAKFTKLIAKKIDATATGGEALTDWSHASDVLTHSFLNRKVYWKDNKLCWNGSFAGGGHWQQYFEANSLLPTPGGYTLKFTLHDNPDTGDHTGSLRVYCNNDIAPSPVITNDNGIVTWEGMRTDGISDPGTYEINFNFNSNTEGWSIFKSEGAGSVLYTDATFQNSSSVPHWNSSVANKIWFAPIYTVDPTDFRMAISDLSLIDNTLIFKGGTSGSWNWDGFNTSLESYVYWDDEENDVGVANNRIQFGELNYLEDPDTGEQTYDAEGNPAFQVLTPCPFVDPESTASIKTPISANQWVNRTINRYEKYEISFTQGLTSGRLDIYYFNSEGYGFRIKQIAPSTYTSIENGTIKKYKTTVMIGAQGDGNMSEKRSGSHLAGQQYQPELQETFVITPSMPNAAIYTEAAFDFDNNEVVGWIDDVTMTRVFDIGMNPETGDDYQEKTVSFNEGVNGWASFKSFVPESGLSLSKNYFTVKQGSLYKHYTPLEYVLNTTVNPPEYEWQKSTVENANNYNVFYDACTFPNNIPEILEVNSSKIKFVLNNDPSVVKMFNTINYEGSQTYVAKPLDTLHITIDNAHAWTNGYDTYGWGCEEIKTDLDAGTVVEFIKKEGKWFNYIKGKKHGKLDTSLFSVQGIGETVGSKIEFGTFE